MIVRLICIVSLVVFVLVVLSMAWDWIVQWEVDER